MCIRELVARRTGVILFYFFRVFQANDSGAKRTWSARHVQRGRPRLSRAPRPLRCAFARLKTRKKKTPVLQARNWRSPNFSTIVTINDQISKQKSGDSHKKLAVWPYFHSKDRDVRERIIVSRGECCFHETHRFLPPSPAQPKWKSLKDKSNITFMCLANNLTVLQFPLNSAADL